MLAEHLRYGGIKVVHSGDDTLRLPIQPGMLFMAQQDFHLDLTRTYFIGDDIRDVEAGAAAGCPTFLVDSEWPLLRLVKEKIVQVRPFSAQL